MWLRRDSGDQWKKVVVDVKVTSTDQSNKAFNENDDKYRNWATEETREKKVGKVVMVPLIISHDGAVHSDTVRRWKGFAPDIWVDWVWMAQCVLRYNVVIPGKFFNKGSWVSEAWRREHPEEFADEEIALRNESRRLRREERSYILNLALGARVCAAFGHATSTRRSVDVRWKGNPDFQIGWTNQPSSLIS